MRRNSRHRTLPVDFDRNLKTRNICIAVLILSWLSALAAIGCAVYLIYYCYAEGKQRWVSVHLSSIAVAFLSLAINIFITSLNEGLGFIHTASLRWALQQEERLSFNTNLRLFSCSHLNMANSWIANAVVLFCVVISYSTPSLLFSPVAYPDSPDTPPLGKFQNMAELNGITLLFFGVGILLQAIIATWALLSSTTEIPTWSSNPIETVKACLQDSSIRRVPDRCIMNVKDATSPAEPRYPQVFQPSMYASHSEVKRVFLLMWAIIPLGALWFGIVYYFVFGYPATKYGDTPSQNWSPIPVGADNGTPYVVWTWLWPSINQVNTALAAIAFVSTIQGILTLALYCMELIVNLHRDEVWWRTATSAHGCRNSKYDSTLQALTSWLTVLLFLFKAIIHWFFGLSLKKFFDPLGEIPFLRFRPMQIFYMTVLMLVLAIIVSVVALRKPKGAQPAAYGHLQTLADCIDDWPPRGDFYWGHKWAGDVVGHAGTSGTKLEDVRIGVMYSGVQP